MIVSLGTAGLLAAIPAAGALVISEATSSSATADWFEVTNSGTTTADVTGYRMDDSSAAFGSAVVLNGITAIAAGESVVFVERVTPTSSEDTAMRATWNLPPGVQVGWYSGSGVGLSSGGDGVTLFDSTGTEISRQSFGAAIAGTSFCWTANNSTAVLSVVGMAGAYTPPPSTALIGSPGLTANPAVPDAPAATAGTGVGATGFSANFAAATSGSAATGLVLEVSTAAHNFAACNFISATGVTGQAAGITLAPTTTCAVITGLLSNTAYVYRVKAANAGGISTASTVSMVTTGALVVPSVSSRLGTFNTGAGAGGCEISAYDAATRRLFTTSSSRNAVEMVDVSNPLHPASLGLIDLAAYGAGPNSVAVGSGPSAGIMAVAVEASPKTLPGQVVFFTVDGGYLHQVEVGALPDMLTFTHDGSKVLVANEAEGSDSIHEAEGSVSIIDVSNGVANATVSHATFSAWNGRESELRARGVRIAANRSVSIDFEPEYIAVSADDTTAIVTLQENNALAVVDIASATVVDIQPLGVKDWSHGQPVLTNHVFDPMPELGVTAAVNPANSSQSVTPQTFRLGGFSGLWYEGVNPVNGNHKFLTVSDRGPNGEPTVINTVTCRPFALPNYQARTTRFELDPVTGEIALTGSTLLTRADGVTPMSGLPNIAGQDEVPVDLWGNTLAYDPLGADLEGIVLAVDGSMWMCDEYRPAIYHFAADGRLLDRFVPQGTAAAAGQPVGTYGSETLPAEYGKRKANRGFEALAISPDGVTLYAFIQSPLSNPNSSAGNASKMVRILAVTAATGQPAAEYVYILDKPALNGGDTIDKMGDATCIGDGKFYVIERGDAVTRTGQKFLFLTDLAGATNVLGRTYANGQTLEQQTPATLAAEGVRPVNKRKIANLPSLGYTAAKAEGITTLPDGSICVLNDNDFGVGGQPIPANGTIAMAATATPIVLGVVSFPAGNTLDASDKDGGKQMQNWPIVGMFMPDGATSFTVAGQTYTITANEGDDRNDFGDLADAAALKSATVDAAAYPAAIKADAQLGRLNISRIDGDLDGDGDIDLAHAYGARSFSIWDSLGNLVFDSGDQLESLIGTLTPEFFNASESKSSEFDKRSDNKGPEPESVTVGEVNGRLYAFIGIERCGGGLMVFDVTTPQAPVFAQYLRTADDAAPEGVIFVSAADLPPGSAPMLIVTNEVSGTVTFYAFANNLPPTIDVAATGVPRVTAYPEFEPVTVASFLVAEVSDVVADDLDSDPLDVLVQWQRLAGEDWVDIPGATDPFLCNDEAPALEGYFRKGDTLRARLTVTDGRVQSSECVYSMPVEILNACPVFSPEAEYLFELNADRDPVTVDAVLHADITGLFADDADGDMLSLVVTWQVSDTNGMWQDLPLDEDGEYLDNHAATRFSKGDLVRAVAVVYDGEETSEPVFSRELDIVNAPPVISAIIEPGISTDSEAAGVNSSLTVDVFGVVIDDADGDPVFFSYQWQRHGGSAWMDIPGATDDRLSAEDSGPGQPPAFVKGDTLRVVVTASDGTDISEDVLVSDELTIGNTPPTLGPVVGELLIAALPDPAVADSVLSIDAAGIAGDDPDTGDTVVLAFQWERLDGNSGAWIAIPGATDDQLSAEDTAAGQPPAFVKGDTLRVVVTASDGTDTSEDVLVSDELTIGNTPPTLGPVVGELLIAALPDPAVADSVLSIDAAGIASDDPDTGDTVVLAFQWERLDGNSGAWIAIPGATDDQLSAEDTATGQPPAFVKGDTLRVVVTASDGTDTSEDALVSDELTIVNTAPTAADTAAGPVASGARLGIDLTAVADDADAGDILGYSATVPAHGTLTPSSTEPGVFTYAADWPELRRDEDGSDSFVYTVSDGEDTAAAEVHVTVTGSNHAPTVAVSPARLTANVQGFTTAVVLTGSDYDADALRFAAGAAGSDAADLTVLTGTVSVTTVQGGCIQADPHVQATATALPILYTPPAGFQGTDRFVVAAKDEANAFSAVLAVTVEVQLSPPWFPMVDLCAFDPGLNPDLPTGIYRVELRAGAAAPLLDVPLRGRRFLEPQDYLYGGHEGLAPGAYSVTVRKGAAATVVGLANAPLAVATYPAAAAAVPGSTNHDDGSSGTEPEWALNSTWNFAFAVQDAAGYELRITQPTGAVQTWRELFMPGPDGALPTERTVLKRGIVLTTPGTYRWSARGFNPVGGTWTAERVFTVAGTTPLPADIGNLQPGGLQPGSGDRAHPVAAGTVNGSTAPVILTWNAVPGATWYRLHLRTYGDVTILNHLTVRLGADTTSYGPVNLAADSYRWYVLAETAGGFSIWSEPAFFSVQAGTTASRPLICSFDHDPDSLAAGAPVRFTVRWDSVPGTTLHVRVANRGTAAEYAGDLAVTPDPVDSLLGHVTLARTATQPFDPAVGGGHYLYRASVPESGGNQSAVQRYEVPVGAGDLGAVALAFDHMPSPTAVIVTPAAAGLVPSHVEFDAVVFDAATLAVLAETGFDGAQAIPANGRIALPASLRQAGTIVTIRCRGAIPGLGTLGPWGELRGYANPAPANP